MPFSITGNSRGLAATIRQSVELKCGALQHTITDQSLRGCLHTRCESATIQCEDCKQSTLLGYNNAFWFFGWHKSTTVNLCVNNLRRANIGDVVMHEWAHSCCWSHGDGHGVPGNDGSLPF